MSFSELLVLNMTYLCEREVQNMTKKDTTWWIINMLPGQCGERGGVLVCARIHVDSYHTLTSRCEYNIIIEQCLLYQAKHTGKILVYIIIIF